MLGSWGSLLSEVMFCVIRKQATLVCHPVPSQQYFFPYFLSFSFRQSPFLTPHPSSLFLEQIKSPGQWLTYSHRIQSLKRKTHAHQKRIRGSNVGGQITLELSQLSVGSV